MTTTTQLGDNAAALSADDEMEQVRELLVGEILRRSDARIDMLEARLKELEAEITHGLEALAARFEAVGAETAAGQHAAFEKLSGGVAELRERIRGLGKG
jgi:hypothetical protein